MGCKILLPKAVKIVNKEKCEEASRSTFARCLATKCFLTCTFQVKIVGGLC